MADNGIASNIQKRSTQDPERIATYSAAVKYITTVLSRDEHAMSRIRKMKSHQDSHEKQWFEGREAIVGKYKRRREGRVKLQGVLSILGGDTSVTTSEINDTEAEKKELEEYDRKVYGACMTMVDSMSKELAELKVPFFCREVASSQVEDTKGLLANKRKILQFLEDITAEDD
ncbi:hypothetical protein V1511DRAFT_509305 [Dipodascopsis uninucleata]